jgi:ribosomal protein L11 methyltransferase
MNDYIQVEFEHLDREQKEIIIALLTEKSYEGFEEEGDLLKAYILSGFYDEQELKTIAEDFHVSYAAEKIENKNWNKEWEENFQPVIIAHPVDRIPFVGIRAGFHPSLKNVAHEIVITPKMSFGTGHHSTTLMMIEMMSELDFTGKNVLDFGTGTGILAILSEKLGASKVIAIDNDDQSIENAGENLQSNHCTKIQLIKASAADTGHKFDIILANIIKSIILGNLETFIKQLNPGGVILLSGLLTGDEKDILKAIAPGKLSVDKKRETGEWMCLKMTFKPAPY